MGRSHRFRRFLIGSAIVIGAVALLIGGAVGALVERHILGLYSWHTAAVVNSEVRRHVAPIVFETGPSPLTAETFRGFLTELPGVFRIKVFDAGGRIIWSDKPELIGRTFPDNSPLRRALANELVATMVQPRRTEHVYEQSYAYVAEVYVPIAFVAGGPVVGVIEAYRDGGSLVADLAAAQRRIWAAIGGGGLVAYLGLAAVAWRVAQAEWRALGRLESENRELAVVQGYTQSLLKPLDLAAVADAVVGSAARGLALSRSALYRVSPDRALSLLAHAGSAGGRALVADKEAPVDAVATEQPVIRGATAAFPVTTVGGGRYLYVGEFPREVGAEDRGALRVLEIMLQEASIALANAELFTEVSRAHEHLATVLSGVTDRMMILDRGMRLLWTNEAGGPETEAHGRPCYEVLGGGDQCLECPGAIAFLSGRPERGRRSARDASGHLRSFDVIAAPLRDACGHVERVLEVARDITDIVHMEERLKDSSARVEAAHATLVVKTAELQAKNQELIALQAQLGARERLAAVGDVTAGLHHAVLNPLTGIAAALDLLERGDVAAGDRDAVFADLRQALGKIERAVKRVGMLRDAAGTPYVGGTTMLDLERAESAGGAQAADAAGPER